MSKLSRVLVVFVIGLGFLSIAAPLILLYELVVFFVQWADQLVKAWYTND